MTGISQGPWALQVAPGDSAGAVKVVSATGGVVALMKAAGGRKVENARAVVEVPAMVEALRWALSMAEEAILVRENGDDPEDTPDICEMHRAELERHRAILSRIEGKA